MVQLAIFPLIRFPSSEPIEIRELGKYDPVSLFSKDLRAQIGLRGQAPDRSTACAFAEKRRLYQVSSLSLLAIAF